MSRCKNNTLGMFITWNDNFIPQHSKLKWICTVGKNKQTNKQIQKKLKRKKQNKTKKQTKNTNKKTQTNKQTKQTEKTYHSMPIINVVNKSSKQVNFHPKLKQNHEKTIVNYTIVPKLLSVGVRSRHIYEGRCTAICQYVLQTSKLPTN